jgi:hypothetical protein|tara:strand:+ start:4665 stop:4973 length:309 start_codon:yes stop_codon:yes gene_type:complete
MKIKVEYTIPTGQFANAKPIVEIDIPDGMTPREQFYYLWDMFHNLSENRTADNQTKPEDYPSGKWGKLKARKEGHPVDNDPYLDGEEDEGARQEDMKRHNKA